MIHIIPSKNKINASEDTYKVIICENPKTFWPSKSFYLNFRKKPEQDVQKLFSKSGTLKLGETGLTLTVTNFKMIGHGQCAFIFKGFCLRIYAKSFIV